MALPSDRPPAPPVLRSDTDPRVFLISDLCALLDTYLEPEQVRDVYRAYLFGAEAHEGQHRRSGEPYIYHPLSVARILANMRMDAESVIAAVLHDVIEDTPTAKDQVAGEFGEEVAELVDGVSKLAQIRFQSRAEAQAENFRKMLMAVARDIRVILIKLADRLHNMRTLGAMPPDKRRRIARETLEIYAPIAGRLGINSMRLELEDLGFQALYPMRYRILEHEVRKARGHRKEIVNKIEKAIGKRLGDEGVEGRIIGREKHLWSIYRKMRSKRLSFAEVFDVYAFRIVVAKVEDCYRVLGIVHNLYKPVPGRFKDYIAIPKTNGYQSLHTALFGPHGVPLEVQLRTEDMDNVAESGIAAHWLYKTGDVGGARAQARAREWLRELLEIQRHAGNSIEFIENVKIDLFPDEVYVFTPIGEIMELPRGATALDFAYAVHSDIGNKCVGAKVDRRLVPLRTPLHNGQTVEIITAPGARPNPAWLDFVTTAKARGTIRHYLKNLKREEAKSLGRRLIDRSLSAFSLSLDDFTEEQIQAVLRGLKVESLDTLLEEVGLGNRMPLLASRRLAHAVDAGAQHEAEDAESNAPLLIKGTEGMVVNLGKCCRPIPGDPILGFVSAGRGVVIHRESCRNVAEYRNRPESWMEVAWDDEAGGEFAADVRVDLQNQKGVLATVASTIAESNSNIENISLDEREGVTTTLLLTLTVSDRRHLARVLRRVRGIPHVSRAYRPRR